MTAFDTTWDLFKFDVHFSDSEYGGHHYPKESGKTRPSEYANNKEYDKKPKMEDIGQQRAVHYRKDDPYWVDLSTAIDKPATPPSTQSDKGTYHRGESTPRLNDDGSYTGVNLSNQDFTDDSKWEEDVESLASIGAHETVHRLQNDDITEWAKEQTGYDPDKNSDLSPIDSFWAGLKEPNEEEQQRKKNYVDLRSIGHEYGAYSATPDSSQPSGFMSPKERKKKMSGQIYPGRDYVMGNKPFSELRQKSEPIIAFDTTWDLLKDFVFAPNMSGDDRHGRFGGYIRGFTAQQVKPIYQIGAPPEMQGSTTPYLDAAAAERLDEAMAGEVMDDYGTPYRIGGSRIRPISNPQTNYLDEYVAVNLPNMIPDQDYGLHDVRDMSLPPDAEKRIIDNIISTLSHEWGHQATSLPMIRDDGVNDSRAHEIAAYTLENPGGLEAHQRATEGLMFQEPTARMPRPYINDQ